MEIRKLIRLGNPIALVFTLIPNLYDALVFFDATLLIARAHKRMVTLEQDRVVYYTHKHE
jgi:hypothetical protein